MFGGSLVIVEAFAHMTQNDTDAMTAVGRQPRLAALKSIHIPVPLSGDNQGRSAFRMGTEPVFPEFSIPNSIYSARSGLSSPAARVLLHSLLTMPVRNRPQKHDEIPGCRYARRTRIIRSKTLQMLRKAIDQ